MAPFKTSGIFSRNQLTNARGKLLTKGMDLIGWQVGCREKLSVRRKIFFGRELHVSPPPQPAIPVPFKTKAPPDPPKY